MTAEAEILMRKVRNRMADDWEFRRFIEYIREHPGELIAAGEAMLPDDFSALL